MTNDRAASRAREEYLEAVEAYRNNNPSAAAFYLGAMAHFSVNQSLQVKD